MCITSCKSWTLMDNGPGNRSLEMNINHLECVLIKIPRELTPKMVPLSCE